MWKHRSNVGQYAWWTVYQNAHPFLSRAWNYKVKKKQTIQFVYLPQENYQLLSPVYQSNNPAAWFLGSVE